MMLQALTLAAVDDSDMLPDLSGAVIVVSIVDP